MADFIMPNDGKITSHYGMRTHPISGVTGKMHWGTDFSGIYGTDSIYAVAAGTVRVARVMGGFGNVIFITHKIKGVTYESVYAHLSSFRVKVGDSVKQGQHIAQKGNTGSSTSKHLHFELTRGGLWENTYKYAIDPLLYISDPETLNIQKLLNTHGYKLVEDGIKGDATDKAIKDFQSKNKLTIDGIAGAATLAQLKRTSKPVAPPVSKPAPPPTSAKEDIRMFNPTSPTLKKAFQDDLAQAVREKLVDNKWLVQLQQNKLSLDDAFALRVIIEQRRGQ